MIRRILKHHILLSTGWTLIILVLSGMPGSKIPHIHIPGIDKVVHFTMYCVFAFLLLNSFTLQKKFRLSDFNKMVVVVVAGASLGALNEILQATIYSGRSAELADEVANIIGTLSGILIYKKLFL